MLLFRDGPGWGDRTHPVTAQVVNPLKRHHDLSSLSPKLLMSCKVVNEIAYFSKSCQITLSLESWLENHRGAVTGMGEAPIHSGQATWSHRKDWDQVLLFVIARAISHFLLLSFSIWVYFNIEFVWLSLFRAHQQLIPAVIPTTSPLWESTKKQDQGPKKRRTAGEKGWYVIRELLCKQEY